MSFTTKDVHTHIHTHTNTHIHTFTHILSTKKKIKNLSIDLLFLFLEFQSPTNNNIQSARNSTHNQHVPLYSYPHVPSRTLLSGTYAIPPHVTLASITRLVLQCTSARQLVSTSALHKPSCPPSPHPPSADSTHVVVITIK